MPPKSLFELATMVCIRNIKLLESLGDLPYETVKDVLMKVDNPVQLRQLELNSPQIQGTTGEMWLKIIERDFPLEYKANPFQPRDPAKWHKVWERYKNQHDLALLESENKLLNQLNSLQKDKEKNTSKIVGGKQVPGSLRVGAPKRHWSQARDAVASSGLSCARPNTGATALRKLRREEKTKATIHGSFAKPNKAAATFAGVQKAPKSMIDEHRRASQPTYRPLELSKPSVVEEHQQRAAYLSDSEDEGNGNSTLPTARSEKKLNKPQMQADKPDVAPPGKPNLSPFQRKFGQINKAFTKPGATTAAPTFVIKKTPARPSKDYESSVKEEAQKRDTAGPSTAPGKSTLRRPPPIVTLPTTRSISSEEANISPKSAEELVEQLNDASDELKAADAEAKKRLARKRKPVGIFMQPKRRIV